MKSTINLSKKTGLFVLMIFLSSALNAATYTTLNNGAWDDVTNVWSLDGVTPCGCTPGANTLGNDVIVNHNLTVPYNLYFNSSNVVIAANKTVSGPIILNVWNTNLDVFGTLDLSRYIGSDLTVTTFHPGSIMFLTNRLAMNFGVLNLDGGLISMSGGNFLVASGATVNVYNGSRVYAANGNIQNDGNINLQAGSCMTAKGNWKNNASGVVAGGGSATTEIGNIQNNGTWDPAIIWCSAGTDTGMPSPENCVGALGVCNGISLPVELTDFSAEFTGDAVLITWTTVSEVNNDHFVVMHSSNGRDWFAIGEVDGMGTTTEKQNYELEHYDMVSGVNYYQLIQVDMDGRENYTDIVSVNVRSNQEELVVYPNPATAFSTIKIKNVGDASGTVSVLNLSGRSVAQTDIHPWSNTVEINLPQLSPGVYIISVEQSGEIRTKKLIVQ